MEIFFISSPNSFPLPVPVPFFRFFLSFGSTCPPPMRDAPRLRLRTSGRSSAPRLAGVIHFFPPQNSLSLLLFSSLPPSLTSGSYALVPPGGSLEYCKPLFSFRFPGCFPRDLLSRGKSHDPFSPTPRVRFFHHVRPVRRLIADFYVSFFFLASSLHPSAGAPLTHGGQELIVSHGALFVKACPFQLAVRTPPRLFLLFQPKALSPHHDKPGPFHTFSASSLPLGDFLRIVGPVRVLAFLAIGYLSSVGFLWFSSFGHSR